MGILCSINPGLSRNPLNLPVIYLCGRQTYLLPSAFLRCLSEQAGFAPQNVKWCSPLKAERRKEDKQRREGKSLGMSSLIIHSIRPVWSDRIDFSTTIRGNSCLLLALSLPLRDVSCPPPPPPPQTGFRVGFDAPLRVVERDTVELVLVVRVWRSLRRCCCLLSGLPVKMRIQRLWRQGAILGIYCL